MPYGRTIANQSIGPVRWTTITQAWLNSSAYFNYKMTSVKVAELVRSVIVVKGDKVEEMKPLPKWRADLITRTFAEQG